MKFVKKSLVAFNIVLVVSLLLAYLSPYFNPNNYWIFSIFGLFYPIILLANVVMVLVWLGLEFKYAFLSLLAIFIGWNHLTGFVNFSTISKDPGDISIMSYNISFFYEQRIGGKAEKDNLEKVKSFFNQHKDVDVFSIQESNHATRNIIKSVLPNYFAHEIPGRGTFILSRYPLLQTGEINFGTKTNSCIWADIKHPVEKIRLYAMHLQSNKVSKDAGDVIDNANLQEKKTWNGIKGILSKYSDTSKTRAKQAKMISDHAKSSPYPVIISGDGNDPPTSFTYSQLCGSYKDSFVEAGAGIGTTYGGRIPMLRIDYIFTDPKIEAESFMILKANFSDHFPIKGVFTLNKEEE